nr:SAP-like protein BP-73 [Tanacetum cinerariifolium]
MESLISLPGIHPPNFSSFTKFKLPTLTFPLKEIADGSLLFTHQFPMSNIRGVRPVQRNSGNRRSINGDDNEKPHLSENGKTYNKEEILALFRRIQSSISAAEFAASKWRTNNASAESVLEVLHQSRKQVKGKTSYREESTGLSERENNKQEKVERIDSVSNEGNL